jgi:hypothetical protein
MAEEEETQEFSMENDTSKQYKILKHGLLQCIFGMTTFNCNKLSFFQYFVAIKGNKTFLNCGMLSHF